MINYIPWIISIIAIMVTIYSLFHKENKDESIRKNNIESSMQIAIARLDAKLDMLMQTLNEMKNSQEKFDKRVDDHETRISKLEQMVGQIINHTSKN